MFFPIFPEFAVFERFFKRKNEKTGNFWGKWGKRR